MQKKSSFREIRYGEKRKKILQSAAKLFARKGYEKASLEEIAACLKLTKASLYHYVKSKEEVLFLIQLDALEEILAAVKQVMQSGLSPSQKLKDIISKYVELVTQKHIIGALRQQELILPKKWRNLIIAERDKFDNECRKIIQEGIESGEFKSKNWKMSYMATIGALNWILKWYSPQGDLSVEEITLAMTDFILMGFGVEEQQVLAQVIE
ncbi:TetR/AcrR family transcriptional regulator [bacterium]|nr:TetR/AcrR family transcriptional regulator [bacterium]